MLEGEKWYSHKCNYFEIPALARPNSIITYGNFERDVVYDYVKDANAVIYELEDGNQACTAIYNSEAEKVLDLTAKRTGNKIEISLTPAPADFTVSVASTDKSVKIKAGDTSAVIEL